MITYYAIAKDGVKHPGFNDKWLLEPGFEQPITENDVEKFKRTGNVEFDYIREIYYESATLPAQVFAINTIVTLKEILPDGTKEN